MSLFFDPYSVSEVFGTISQMSALVAMLIIGLYMARIYGGTYKAALGEVVLSALLSVITLPIITQIAEYILQKNLL